MIVTVNEAKQKWCPMVRHIDLRADSHGTAAAGSNAGGKGRVDEANCCVGPQCMMWRFAEAMHDGTETGFCGLAGAVE